ncbi:HYC_CC_PP family protein [Rubrolithibacter danxiaensis]|uniref:HYC_CC_PP family protein n=1 Tax=Rubrolithibacter danxiaensis TaxID=3390805 RepID=UPI003BF858FC
MKKALVTILAFFYLGISSGATVQLHYCMGKLINWELGEKAHNKVCSNCGMKKEKAENCCKDEVKQVKLDKSHTASEASFLAKVISSIPIIRSFTSFSFPGLTAIIHDYPVSNAPPRVHAVSNYILHCIFRI